MGAAIVGRLLARGHTVATFSRRTSESIDEFRRSETLSDRLMYEEIDLADAAATRQFVQAVHQRHGRIDALVNNAAIAEEGVLATLDDAAIGRMVQINLASAIQLTKECVRLMLLKERGTVVNITSVAASRGFPGLSVYAATKAALEGFTRSLAREVGPRGIRVNAIAPGYLETEMSAELDDELRRQIIRRTPAGRLGSVDDIVPWVEFLLDDASGFMTGQVLTVDGGASV